MSSLKSCRLALRVNNEAKLMIAFAGTLRGVNLVWATEHIRRLHRLFAAQSNLQLKSGMAWELVLWCQNSLHAPAVLSGLQFLLPS